ncbi:MAG TPA: tetratricopeptide repeat protein [Verrucomicrobiota bacterium]|nr:tetratricopeptide repeat protein [Verrucomicrobiota bacterium]
MLEEIPLTTIEKLASIVSTYDLAGVGAILLAMMMIFLFRAYRKGIPSPEKRHYVRLSWIFLGASLIALAFAVSPSLKRKPVETYSGKVRGLVKDLRKGEEEFSSQVYFSSSRVFFRRDQPSDPNKFNVDWIYYLKDEQNLSFTIRTDVVKRRAIPADMSGVAAAETSSPKTVCGEVRLDQSYFDNRKDDLIYFTTEGFPATPGQLSYYEKNGKTVLIRWLDRNAWGAEDRPRDRGWLASLGGLLVGTAHAQVLRDSPAAPEPAAPLSPDRPEMPSGLSEAEVQRVLDYARQLADNDLQVQMSVRQAFEKESQAGSFLDTILERLIFSKGGFENPERLVACIDSILRGNPNLRSPLRLMRLGESYFRINDYDRTDEIFTRVQQDYPGVAFGLVQLWAWGVALREIGKPSESRKKIEEGLEFIRALPAPGVCTGVILGSLCMADTTAFEEHMDYPDARAFHQLALTTCTLSIEEGLSNAAAKNNLAWIMAIGPADPTQLGKALTIIDEVLAGGEEDNKSYLDTKATILCKLGRKAEGQKILEGICAGLPPEACQRTSKTCAE